MIVICEGSCLHFCHIALLQFFFVDVQHNRVNGTLIFGANTTQSMTDPSNRQAAVTRGRQAGMSDELIAAALGYKQEEFAQRDIQHFLEGHSKRGDERVVLLLNAIERVELVNHAKVQHGMSDLDISNSLGYTSSDDNLSEINQFILGMCRNADESESQLKLRMKQLERGRLVERAFELGMSDVEVAAALGMSTSSSCTRMFVDGISSNLAARSLALEAAMDHFKATQVQQRVALVQESREALQLTDADICHIIGFAAVDAARDVESFIEGRCTNMNNSRHSALTDAVHRGRLVACARALGTITVEELFIMCTSSGTTTTTAPSTDPTPQSWETIAHKIILNGCDGTSLLLNDAVIRARKLLVDGARRLGMTDETIAHHLGYAPDHGQRYVTAFVSSDSTKSSRMAAQRIQYLVTAVDATRAHQKWLEATRDQLKVSCLEALTTQLTQLQQELSTCRAQVNEIPVAVRESTSDWNSALDDAVSRSVSATATTRKISALHTEDFNLQISALEAEMQKKFEASNASIARLAAETADIARLVETLTALVTPVPADQQVVKEHQTIAASPSSSMEYAATIATSSSAAVMLQKAFSKPPSTTTTTKHRQLMSADGGALKPPALT